MFVAPNTIELDQDNPNIVILTFTHANPFAMRSLRNECEKVKERLIEDSFLMQWQGEESLQFDETQMEAHGIVVIAFMATCRQAAERARHSLRMMYEMSYQRVLVPA
jgi:hypothetical protein